MSPARRPTRRESARRGRLVARQARRARRGDRGDARALHGARPGGGAQRRRRAARDARLQHAAARSPRTCSSRSTRSRARRRRGRSGHRPPSALGALTGAFGSPLGGGARGGGGGDARPARARSATERGAARAVRRRRRGACVREADLRRRPRSGSRRGRAADGIVLANDASRRCARPRRGRSARSATARRAARRSRGEATTATRWSARSPNGALAPEVQANPLCDGVFARRVADTRSSHSTLLPSYLRAPQRRLRRRPARRAAILRARHPAHPHRQLRPPAGRLPQGQRHRQRARQPRPHELRRDHTPSRRAAHLRLVPRAAAPPQGLGQDVPPIPYKGATDGQTAFYPSQIQHVGGATFSPASNAFFELQQWMSNGRDRGRLGRGAPAADGRGRLPQDFRDGAPRRRREARHRRHGRKAIRVRRLPRQRRADARRELRVRHLPLGRAERLLHHLQGRRERHQVQLPRGAGVRRHAARDLAAGAPAAGAAGRRRIHTGGVFFASKQDSGYLAMLAWATAAGPPTTLASRSAGRQFFDENVMPSNTTS